MTARGSREGPGGKPGGPEEGERLPRPYGWTGTGSRYRHGDPSFCVGVCMGVCVWVCVAECWCVRECVRVCVYVCAEVG